MKINFSELLSSERIRPLWGRSHTPESALASLQQYLSGAKQIAAAGASPGAGGGVGNGLAGAPAASGGGVPPGQAAAAAASSPSFAAATGPAGGPPAGSSSGSFGGSPDAGRPGQAAGPVAAQPGLEMAKLTDLADVPIEAPHLLFSALEQTIERELGSRTSMLRPYLEALRVRIHRLDPTAPEAVYHPLRHAAGGSIGELLAKLEDTLAALRRVAAAGAFRR